MILDNENENLKVHEWISKYTEGGKFDIVTGYFTIGALAYFSQKVKEKIEHFRLVLGDIVNIDSIPVLLNQKEVLNALTFHKKKYRFVPKDVDKREESAIQKLVDTINKWIKSQAAEEKEQEDGIIEKKIGKEACFENHLKRV